MRQLLSAFALAGLGIVFVFIILSVKAVEAENTGTSQCPVSYQSFTPRGLITGYAGNTFSLNPTIHNPYSYTWNINVDWQVGDSFGNYITGGTENVSIPPGQSEMVPISVPMYGSSAVLINDDSSLGGGYSTCNIG